MAIKFPADGNTYVGWLEDATGEAVTIASAAAADFGSIVDLSCDIQSGGLDLGVDTAVIDAASLCDAFVAQAQGRTSVSPTLTGWRYKQPDDTFWDIAEKGTLGWLLIRTGVPSDQVLADGDDVTLAWLEMSEPSPEFPGGDTLTTFMVSLTLVNGQKFSQKVTLGGS